MCGAGAAPKVGYMNGSGGVTPLCHMLSTDFFSYSTMHDIDGTAGTTQGPLS